MTAQRPPGPYALQAAIVAVHTEAPTAEQTDWPQILALYDLLLAAHPNPVTALNRAVAVGEVHGPAAGLAAVAALADDPRLGHRLDAVRGYFLARAGDASAAADAYARAAAAAPQDAERRHLATRAAPNLKGSGPFRLWRGPRTCRRGSRGRAGRGLRRGSGCG